MAAVGWQALKGKPLYMNDLWQFLYSLPKLLPAILILLVGLTFLGPASCGYEEDVDYGYCKWVCPKRNGYNDDLVRSECKERACDDSPRCVYTWKPPEFDEDKHPEVGPDGFLEIDTSFGCN